MRVLMGLDFETFGTRSLPDVGLANYLDDPQFRVLLASTAVRDATSGMIITHTFDFISGNMVHSPGELPDEFETYVSEATLVAHNAAFEIGVLKKKFPRVAAANTIIDSAVIARGVGAGSKLEAAAPQLLDVNKMDVGKRLIQKFSMPLEDGTILVDQWEDWDEETWDDWRMFVEYCEMDAKLSLMIAEIYWQHFKKEIRYQQITQQMNEIGWHVDLDLVARMQAQYLQNLEDIEADFRRNYGELNFNSNKQLTKWCADRGMRATSFDKLSVSKLLAAIGRRRGQWAKPGIPQPTLQQVRNLNEISAMLYTKQALGGSSLTKLKTIQDLVSPDGRLRDQYLHVGAGQTFRTSGRGVQMQNLKRLGPNPDDVTNVSGWNNDELARNLRQVFCAEHPDGQLIVADYSAIESRGLAWLAGSEWKIHAYEQGRDMYKVLAERMTGTPYEQVTAEQRQLGKVGELSCGYGAGAGAVASFAEKMGTPLTQEQASEIVTGWRDTNPEIVSLWSALDETLHRAVRTRSVVDTPVAGGKLSCMISPGITPESILALNPRAQTITVQLVDTDSGEIVLTRWFQGVYYHGSDLCYYKPSLINSGPLWLDEWSKNGQRGRYKLYGGKLTGILTQSLCRELFFIGMLRVHRALENIDNAALIGQFHDELVLEWRPPTSPDAGAVPSKEWTLDEVLRLVEMYMTNPHRYFAGLPLAVDVKHAYRYIK